MFADGTCNDAWEVCSSDVVRREHRLDIGYAAMRVLYLFSDLLFCYKFNSTTFSQNTLLLVGLAIVQATN